MSDNLRLLAPEVARACGIGELTNCCAFLVASPEGFACAQRTSLADGIYNRVRDGIPHSRRTPESDFPSCQQEGRS